MLEQNIRLMEPQMTASQQLPQPQVQVPLRDTAPVPPHQQHEFLLPPNTVGLAQRIRKQLFPAESPANPDSKFQRITPVPASAQYERTIMPTSVVKPQASAPGIAKSTKWFWKKREQKKAAGECVKEYTRKRETLTYTCGKCGQSRVSQTGHTQYYGNWYCKSTAIESFEEWRSSREKCRLEKKAREREQKEKEDT